METINQIIKEINKLKEYKKLYEHQLKDKARMSDLLFELMTEKYNNTSYEQRVDDFQKDMCRDCRYEYYCTITLPEDIRKPIPSDKKWIPETTSCGKFEWD